MYFMQLRQPCPRAHVLAAKDVPVQWLTQTYDPITIAPGDTVTFTWAGESLQSSVAILYPCAHEPTII